MNRDDREPSLESLIERCAELKRALVDFALSPRFERHLERFMLEATDPYQELSEGDAIGVIDRFVLQRRLPNGKPFWISSWPASRTSPQLIGRCCAAGATWWRGSSRSGARLSELLGR